MNETTSQPFTAASFYHFISEKRLVGTRCPFCDAVYLPPRVICPRCFSDDLEWTELSGEGKLAAFTSIYIAPTFMIEQGYGREAPYLTGIVELDEGPMISARILGLDPERPQGDWIGTRLVVAFIQRGEGEEMKTDLAFHVK